MSSATKSREIQIPIQALRRGLFVSGLDRDWSETPFIFQGFLIEGDQEIADLSKLCAWVAIDPALSDAEAVRPILEGRIPDQSEPDAPVRRAAAPGRRTESVVPKTTPRGEPVPWLRRSSGKKRKASKKRKTSAAPFVAIPDNERSPLVPRNIPLVRYRYETPFEKEIEAADDAASVADDALKTLLGDLDKGGELNLVELRSSAQDLALSVVRNPDALQWLVRMRDTSNDIYTHGVKVAVYLMTFARHLGFAPGELVQMATIGLLLDVGKIYIDHELLHRAGPLSDAERARVQEHVNVGVEALAGEGSLPNVVIEAIAEHHERADGTGYPNQLALEAISIHGRMAAIVDSFAAMTSRRSYASTLAPFKAMKLMYGEAGTKFHAPLVEQFVQALGIFPTGALVELSTGEVAIVVCHNRVRRLEPRVLVVTDAAKKSLAVPYEFDLMTQSQDTLHSKPVRIDKGLADGAYGLDLAALYAG